MHEIDFVFKSYLAPVLWGLDGPEYKTLLSVYNA